MFGWSIDMFEVRKGLKMMLRLPYGFVQTMLFSQQMVFALCNLSDLWVHNAIEKLSKGMLVMTSDCSSMRADASAGTVAAGLFENQNIWKFGNPEHWGVLQ